MSVQAMTAAQNPKATPLRVLNMSTGPVEVSQRVMRAQQVDLLTPHTSSFWECHDATVASLSRVLLTTQKTLVFHGSIRTGIDLALGNFIRPGIKVLCIVNGFWGELVAQWAERYGAAVDRLSFDLLEPVDVDVVEAGLRKNRYDIVAVVHVETNSGVVNPIAEIGALVSQTEALYFVDTACSAGAIKIETDNWGIDIQTTGSHKCLASVPGLAVVTISDKAWKRLRDDGRQGSYFDFRNWWASTMVRDTVPPFTQPTTLVAAMQASLSEIEDHGLDNWWAVHRTVADRVIDGMRSIGFELLLDRGPAGGRREIYSDTVIAVRYPDHISDEKYRKLLLEQYGIFVIGNVGEFSGRSFRIGLMSPPQIQAVNLYGALAAFKEAAQSPLVRR